MRRQSNEKHLREQRVWFTGPTVPVSSPSLSGSKGRNLENHSHNQERGERKVDPSSLTCVLRAGYFLSYSSGPASESSHMD